MKIIVNGEAREVEEGSTVAGLLTALDLPVPRVGVERNREVVSRDRYGQVRLEEGDRIEIVRFVGGGL